MFWILRMTIQAYSNGCSVAYLTKFSRPIRPSAASRPRSGYFFATRLSSGSISVSRTCSYGRSLLP